MKRKSANGILLLESVIIIVLLAIIIALLLQTASEKQEQNLSEQKMEEVAEPTEDLIEEVVEAVPQSNPAEASQMEETDASAEEQENIVEAKAYNKKIVVFGDSLWDGWRDETGIAYQVSEQTGATVYNCTIGGSRATSDSNNTDVRGVWNSQSLNTMMYVARGELSADEQLAGLPALEVIKEVDFTTVDYVIFSYGLNDYFFNVPVDAESGMYEMDTYMGALRHAANKMRESYPNLQIIFITPTYCDMWSGEEDCTTHNFGNGVLPDYVNGMITASEQVNTYLLNMYEKMELNADNLKEYSDDGVHLNQAGREKYARIVSGYINSII
ncbi:MAG: SGNH/GDSL hydrolase family protein [Lachnospiraceae bacterium]|nr:SGNH/GDSL hydrolase family protein [Lachnospiraceae bacterium]